MTKDEAIETMKEYNENQAFDWDAIPVVDLNPVELKDYWTFKNYYEPREVIRGNDIAVRTLFPGIRINKVSRQVQLIGRKELNEILKIIS